MLGQHPLRERAKKLHLGIMVGRVASQYTRRARCLTRSVDAGYSL
jgi:hypothetical protein